MEAKILCIGDIYFRGKRRVSIRRCSDSSVSYFTPKSSLTSVDCGALILWVKETGNIGYLNIKAVCMTAGTVGGFG